MSFLQHRHLVPEQMDADDVDPHELARALRFIRRINRLLRYNATVVRAILHESANFAGPVSVLDVGAGTGDLLELLHATAGDQAFHLIGLDRHASTVDQGSSLASTNAAGIRFVRGDALALPFTDGSIDFVISTLFLHHLPEDVAIAALREMSRVARRGVIVADLLRSRRAYVWITLFTLFSSPMIRHDARVSVAHAFTIDEAKKLAQAAGLNDVRFERTFGHRFLMRWRR